MLSAERKSLVQFVSLFFVLNFGFLLVALIFYYNYQKEIYIDIYSKSIFYFANKVTFKAAKLHDFEDLKISIQKDPRFEVFLISKNNIVFASENIRSIKFKEGFEIVENALIYAAKLNFENAQNVDTIVIKRTGIEDDLRDVRNSIYKFSFVSCVFIFIAIFSLTRLFLRPMRLYINRLDKFIRDTTHELNTPLSVISMSVERMNIEDLNDNNQKHLKRINIASKTIATLYDDLIFLMQYKNFRDKITEFDISDLINERICYFRELAVAKKIQIYDDLKPCVLKIDKTKLVRIIDNLLSNAVKYNKKNGTITVNLNQNFLEVIDTGVGIKEEKINDAFKLYTRFDDANGGFGIGLNLLKMICDEYGFEIVVNSKINLGTSFKIIFTSH